MRHKSDWDEIWADYDARRPVPPPEAASTTLPARQSYPPRAAPRRARGPRWILLIVALTIAAIWLAAPAMAAWQVARAVARQDHAAVARHVDPLALQDSLRRTLAGPAGLPGEGPGAGYLAALTNDLVQAWSRPAALTEVARTRGAREEGMVATLLRIRPVSLTSFDLPLDVAGAPMRLRFQLVEGWLTPRWQVRGVQLDDGAPGVASGPARR